MKSLIQLLFSVDMAALAGTAFSQFSQKGIDIGTSRNKACAGFGTGTVILGVATA